MVGFVISKATTLQIKSGGPSTPSTKPGQKRRNSGDEKRPLKRTTNPLMGAGVSPSQKTHNPSHHGVGKGLMTSQGPVAPPTVNSELATPTPAVTTVQSLVRNVDLNECSMHETEHLGDAGPFDLMKASSISYTLTSFSYLYQV